MNSSTLEKEYQRVRRRILYERADMEKLETVIGRHAIVLIDYKQATSVAKKTETYYCLNEIQNAWVYALLKPEREDSHARNPPKPWSPDDLNYRFRELVVEMVCEFGDNTIRALDGQTHHINLDSIAIYSHLHGNIAREAENTRRHFEQYTMYLMKLAQVDNDSDNFISVANALIWSGIRLGAYIDSVL